MTDRVLMVDGNGIDVGSIEDVMKIARQRTSDMLQKFAEELCGVQPMNTNTLDGLTFPLRYETKS